MGMFDRIRCEYPLPIKGANDREYQTKSLSCELQNYVITDDGILTDSDGEQVNYRGEIRFYDIGSPDMNDGVIFDSDKKLDDPGWIEFSALFNQGKLIDIVTVVWREPSNHQVQRKGE
jgi:hypothetical protein